ncbi:MAG: hypothetical protein EOP04_11155 [Proteobacteria bacterium]|nr:MAG: hypothetical protein EOP04_11155 [Pseudomonadota bacterium]
MRVFTIIVTPIILFACTSRTKNKVTYLDLSNQKLKVVPDSVFRHKELQTLLLGNTFTIYPPLSALGKDRFTEETHNTIRLIQEDIEQLKHLKTLSLSGNDLRSLPKALSTLSELDTLDLFYNSNLDITKELITLKKMTHLKYLGLIGTRLNRATANELKQSLPDTRVVTTMDDLEEEALH